ncbi:hypothetical protein BXZ70DRAFT_562579 [Cristinia sonorae]|uniref:Uncharacterized protein n=1 Tax=Cristinia sonorae TaxID=1940300 RepID=A0A8K0XLH9_9AGAR|nr:hypothetical protein BXZ70DRAFT_562579 [Cristinia sonorae]
MSMHPFRKNRCILYSFILVSALLELTFDLMVALDGAFPDVQKFMTIVGFIAAALSTLKLVWACLLLAYNNKPNKKLIFTRASYQYASLLVASLISALITIPLFTKIPAQCDFKRESDGMAGFYCAWLSLAIVFPWAIVFLSGASAFLIYRTALMLNLSLDRNIVALDESGAIPL